MRAWLGAAVAVVLAAAAPRPGSAQNEVPDGCFCLRHLATEQVLRACTGFKPPRSYFGRARCLDERGEDFPVLMTEAWAVVADGAAGCEPCRRDVRLLRNVPRKPDPKPEGRPDKANHEDEGNDEDLP